MERKSFWHLRTVYTGWRRNDFSEARAQAARNGGHTCIIFTLYNLSRRRLQQVALALGGSDITYKSALNVLKDAYDVHSCCLAR